MSINIKILGVKDGDANIIALQKNSKSLVILIDSGAKQYAKKVCAELDKTLGLFGKNAPDLIVCTHFDSDHIGGMSEIVQYYAKQKKMIGRVWLHKPAKVLDELISLGENYRKDKLKFKPFTEVNSLKESMLMVGKWGYAEMFLESVPQLKSLVQVIKDFEILIEEPFADIKFSLDGWPELEIVGPSKSFFKSLFPYGITAKDIIKEEAIYNHLCEIKLLSTLDKKPCEILDQDEEKKEVTKTNMASIILCITWEGKKYLFSGDSNITALKNVPDYKNKLSKIYFLKIPHHASRNNLSTDLIRIMTPKYAYVSGDKYIDDEVLGCLKAKGANVKVTRNQNQDLVFPSEQDG